MCYCILKVKNLWGEEINVAIKISTTNENAGKNRREVIENRTKLRRIVEEFNELYEKCSKISEDHYYCMTIEVVIDEVVIPQTTLKIPKSIWNELRKFLLQVRKLYTEQQKQEMRSFLSAFFNGDLYTVVSN